MSLTRDDVKRVATLARMELTPKEEEQLTKQLGSILHYIDKLNELDTEKVEPLAHVGDIVNAFREDRVTNTPATDPLLANAPDREEDYIKVPNIIE
ncbi:MAG: Asp-tRNA(Asn)/Glu-tRNA(Gln) amidotransferase subunit GatC [Deltaproteobacteria bacterium]|nr:Asp-tRNA(Asn)/Glu-tRNA(Gln) amidotransferase subunit GatC [Deltaproteobacteria bacterium]